MNLGDIRWPASPDEAATRYLAFVVQVVQWSGLTFDEKPSPLELANKRLSGAIAWPEYAAHADRWWGKVESAQFRGTGTPGLLMARLALCILTVKPTGSGHEEELSWFLQVLAKLNVPLDEPLRLMKLRLG